MICLKTFKHKQVKTFRTYQGWCNFVNRNLQYAKHKSETFDWIGKCEASDLPSFHPYYEYLVKCDNKKALNILKNNIEAIKKDFSLMKYIYNSTTTIPMLEEKARVLELKIKKSDT